MIRIILKLYHIYEIGAMSKPLQNFLIFTFDKKKRIT